MQISAANVVARVNRPFDALASLVRCMTTFSLRFFSVSENLEEAPHRAAQSSTRLRLAPWLSCASWRS
jgi:hypothetical protein